MLRICRQVYRTTSTCLSTYRGTAPLSVRLSHSGRGDLEMATEQAVVPREELHRYVVRCMEAVGSRKEHSEALAELLVSADYRGHYSHGLNRLDMYVKELQTGMTSSGNVEPSIVKESAATALVDGHNVLGTHFESYDDVLPAVDDFLNSQEKEFYKFGTEALKHRWQMCPVVGKFCMDLAISKAKATGIGWVSARGSNHFGIAGWYTIRAQEQGLLGMSFTNTSPLMVPTRAKQPTLGTNPISLAAPAKNGDSMVLDMATTSVALGKVEIQDRKGEMMPSGWAIDSSGKETHNPKEIAGLLPLGGTEQSSGYKGYGLAMMVEIFCGIMSGSTFGPNIRSWKDFNKAANLGQCFVAIDPNAFADGFTDRMSSLIDHCRNLDPAEGDKPVLVPGDPERQHMEECDKLGGIPYHPNQITYAKELAERLGVHTFTVKT